MRGKTENLSEWALKSLKVPQTLNQLLSPDSREIFHNGRFTNAITLLASHLLRPVRNRADTGARDLNEAERRHQDHELIDLARKLSLQPLM
jgi:hypothetical protein